MVEDPVVEQVQDGRVDLQLAAPAHLELVLRVDVRLRERRRAPVAVAAVEVEQVVMTGDHRQRAAEGTRARDILVQPDCGAEGQLVDELPLDLERAIGRQHAIQRPALAVELFDRIVEQAPNVRADAADTTASLIRLRQTRVVAVVAAQGIAAVEAPARREPLVEREFGRVILPLGLRQLVLASRPGIDVDVIHDVERRRLRLTRVAYDVRLVVRDRIDGACILDAAIELLVDVAEADRGDGAELMLETERGFLRTHRLDAVADTRTQTGSGVPRGGPQIALRDERSRARRRAGRVAVQRFEVRIVEREIPLNPLRTAERLLAEIQLEDVVEYPPGSVHLPAAIALHVIGESGAGRQLVLEAEFDRIRSVEVVRGGVGWDLLIFCPDAEVHGQLAAHRPGILDEQAQDVRLDVALRDETLSGARAVAADLVIPVRALRRRRAVLTAPVQAGRRFEVAPDDVVAPKISLKPALDLMIAGLLPLPRRIRLQILALQDVELAGADGRHVRVAGAVLQVVRHSRHADVAAVEDEPHDVGDVVVVRVRPEVARPETQQELRRHGVVGHAGKGIVRRLVALLVVGGRIVRAGQRRQLAVGLAPAVVERDARPQLVAQLHRLVRRQELHFLLVFLRNRGGRRSTAGRGRYGALGAHERRLIGAEEPPLAPHDRTPPRPPAPQPVVAVFPLLPVLGNVRVRGMKTPSRSGATLCRRRVRQRPNSR